MGIYRSEEVKSPVGECQPKCIQVCNRFIRDDALDE